MFQWKFKITLNVWIEKSPWIVCEKNPEFEYSIENEELNKKLQNVILSQKSFEKEFSQLKVENQWLASSQKKSEKIGGKLEESAREIQELRKELQEEKIKVKPS